MHSLELFQEKQLTIMCTATGHGERRLEEAGAIVGRRGRLSNFSTKLRPCLAKQWPYKYKMYKKAKIDENIPCGSKVMRSLTQRHRSAKIMLAV